MTQAHPRRTTAARRRLYFDELAGRAQQAAAKAQLTNTKPRPNKSNKISTLPLTFVRRRLYFDELVGRAQEAAAKAERAARRAREDFSYMLRHMRDVKPDTTWEEAQAICGKEPEWKEVGVYVCMGVCVCVGGVI